MMATTHAFAGLALAAVVAVAAPELAVVVAIAAIAGGLFPDLDLYAGHRKTLHFPVYYAAVALPAVGVALLAPTATTIGVAVFLVAAAFHSATDAVGGGLELKPWEGTSERAVYSHYHDRWIAPRRWVRYDGAPEDLVLASILAVPPLLVFEGTVRTGILTLLAVSVGYAAVRKPMVEVTERAVARAPDDLVARLPERFLPIDERGTDRHADGR